MTTKENDRKADSRSTGIGFTIIIILLSFPVAIIISRWMPEVILPIGDGYSIHGILCAFSAAVLLNIVLYPFRSMINVVGIVGGIIVAALVWNGNLQKEDVRDLFYRGSGAITKNVIAGRSISHETEIRKALADNRGIEEFVEENSGKFDHVDVLDSSILKSFSIFSYISGSNWNYIDDPKNRELFRPVSETIKTHSGDCDDHAICLAACMKQCGACVRIVHAHGHLYPQLLVGEVTDKARIVRTIKSLYPKTRFKEICFTEDENKLWLNMDYTSNYPGGHFLSEFDLEALELCDR